MKDSELRGHMLQKFYAVRRQGYTQMPTDEIFDQDTAFDICRQLSDHGLINWKPIAALGKFRSGMGQITASGVDVIEGTKEPPISIVLDHSVSVMDSSNVQIGKGNTQNINLTAHDIEVAIDKTTADVGEKEKAKTLVERLIENPILSKILNIG